MKSFLTNIAAPLPPSPEAHASGHAIGPYGTAALSENKTQGEGRGGRLECGNVGSRCSAVTPARLRGRREGTFPVGGVCVWSTGGLPGAQFLGQR
jgi:hypothetical protein